MAYKTTIECVTHRCVGFSAIDDTYVVDGSTRPTVLALYDEEDNLLEVLSNGDRRMSTLSANTTYKFKTVYLQGSGIGGVVPDTTVMFTTKANSFYTPVVDQSVPGQLSVAEMQDDYWPSPSVGIQGFGVGVELLNDNNTVIDRKFQTPCTFTGIEGTSYKLRAFDWNGYDADNLRTKATTISGTDVQIEISNAKLAVFAFPDLYNIELHIRLEGFSNPSNLAVNVDGAGEPAWSKDSGITNQVYVVELDKLEQGTTYSIVVTLLDGASTYTKTLSVTTKSGYRSGSGTVKANRFKDFWIAVGEPGAYSESMEYNEVFGMHERFGIKIKHAPFSAMPKIKNVVVQSWKDENGDDVWLPRKTGSEPGVYIPAITHEAVDYNPTFVIYGDANVVDVNIALRELLDTIRGRWLKIWDEYTRLGYEGVYLLDCDDDPKFKRRGFDYVEFELKFRVNGMNIDAPFDGINI